jgi:HSP20 family molecular chaperone IbpA
MKELQKTLICPEIFVTHDDKDEGLVIEAALPGVAKENVSLTLGDAHFCLTGERDDARFDGCYQLAHEIDNHQADAKLENGLLRIHVPFKEPLRGIPVAIA